MRVLTTESFHYAAYPLIRCLRPHAESIGVLTDGSPGLLGRSRFVDFHAPLALPRRIPASSLTSGDRNTREEDAYVEELLRVCRRHRVDVVLPTTDYEVYLYARNRPALEGAGIFAPVSAFDSTRSCMDNEDSVNLARASGVPAPRVLAVDERRDAASAAGEIGYPVVVKPRFSVGSFGISRVDSPERLAPAVARLRGWAGGVVVQEYVPGDVETSIHTVLDSASNPLFLLYLGKVRHAAASLSTTIVTLEDFPETAAVLAYMRALGMRGPVNVQLKRDPRDGSHKFIESNPRWGANARIWLRMATKAGLNPVLDAATLQGSHSRETSGLPPGKYGTSPVEDVLALWSYATHVSSRAEGAARLTWRRVLASYVRSYALRRPTSDFFWSTLPRDPVAVGRAYRRTIAENRDGNVEIMPLGGVDL